MSIINDALKKTQNVYQAQKKNQTPRAQNPGISQPPRIQKPGLSPEGKTKDTMVLITTIIVAGGFVGCLIVLSILLWPKDPIDQKALTEKFSLSDQSAISSIETVRASSSSSDPSLRGIKLTGIAIISGEQTALISGKIVKEGDEIKGKKVLRILNNQVKLFGDGKIFILDLKP
ncbi:MAG: hypothetical protein P9M07_01330 [Candidatus Aceula meridiana]|nr:hypothetical protein [Candidatus Aceula meridiana]